MELRNYQKTAVNAVYEHLRTRDDNPCVVCPTGCGKSLILAQIAKDAVQKWNGRVLVLAHVKELLEQNADKIRRLCPELKIGIYSAGLKSRDTSEPVIVAGIQSVYDKACDLGVFDLIIVDECFPAGTLIDTPRGEIPIEDLYVGQPVRHALGVGNIEAISSRPATEIMKLELSNGRSIECTPNHPFFTESGWCAASALAVGSRLYSRKEVSRLRQEISSECLVQSGWEADKESGGDRMEPASMLFERLCQKVDSPEMCGTESKKKSKHGAKSIALDDSISECGKDMSMLRSGIFSMVSQRKADAGERLEQEKILFNILSSESRKSDVSRKNMSESARNFAKDTLSPDSDWRKWKGNASPPVPSFGDASCGNGIFSDDDSPATSGRRIQLLQAGCGDTLSASWNPTGRSEPLYEENPQDGQTDSQMAGGIRVVGIARVKLESPRVVYNLQIEGHPSYYADGVLVHNCHLIAPDGDGMYRTFLKNMKVINPRVRLIGLTATPFRLKGGLICQPDNLLNEVCYEAGLKEMIQQGYLSPLISKSGRVEAKLDDLHIRGGEFVNDEIAEAMDKEDIVSAACREIVELTRERKSVLIFGSSIAHCEHIAEKITAFSGKECAVVTGNTPSDEREEIIARFRGEPVKEDFFSHKPSLKYVVNMNVLSVGFDAPNVDCVVLLRPTNSPGLLVQQVGRGTRLCEGKRNCLVLDYSGNILRHGPVDMINVKEPGAGKGGDAPAKKCPQCLALIHAAYQKCPECGYEFPPPETSNLSGTASSAGVLSGQVDYTDYAVRNTYYAVHEKRYADPETPKTMRVDYQVGFNDFKSEWVCPEHTGYARGKFEKWWRERAALGCPIPATAREAVSQANEGLLAESESITVKTVAGEKFERIIGWRLKERPVMPESGEDPVEASDWHSNSPEDIGFKTEPFDDEEIPF